MIGFPVRRRMARINCCWLTFSTAFQGLRRGYGIRGGGLDSAVFAGPPCSRSHRPREARCSTRSLNRPLSGRCRPFKHIDHPLRRALPLWSLPFANGTGASVLVRQWEDFSDAGQPGECGQHLGNFLHLFCGTSVWYEPVHYFHSQLESRFRKLKLFDICFGPCWMSPHGGALAELAASERRLYG